MTPAEFRAWFEGFCEGMEGLPSVKQWERIKERVREIDGKPVAHAVFVDRYWPGPSYPWPRSPYNDMYWPWQRYGACSGGAQQNSQYTLQGLQNANIAAQGVNIAAQGMNHQRQDAMGARDFVSHAQEMNVANQMGQQVSDLGPDFDIEAAMRALGRKDYSDSN